MGGANEIRWNQLKYPEGVTFDSLHGESKTLAGSDINAFRKIISETAINTQIAKFTKENVANFIIAFMGSNDTTLIEYSIFGPINIAIQEKLILLENGPYNFTINIDELKPTLNNETNRAAVEKIKASFKFFLKIVNILYKNVHLLPKESQKVFLPKPATLRFESAVTEGGRGAGAGAGLMAATAAPKPAAAESVNQPIPAAAGEEAGAAAPVAGSPADDPTAAAEIGAPRPRGVSNISDVSEEGKEEEEEEGKEEDDWPEPPPAPAPTGPAAKPETVTYFGKEVPKNIIERLKAFAPIPEEAGTEREQQAQFFSAIRNLLIDVQGRKDVTSGFITIEIPEILPASSTGGAGAGAGSVPAKRTGGARRSRKTRRRNKPLRKARTRRH